MGVGHKQRPIFKNHHRQGTMRRMCLIPQNLVHIVEMPSIFAKGSADQAIRLFAVDHDGCNRGCIRAHHRTRDIRRDTLARHDRMIRAPIIAVTWIIFRVHDFKVPIRSDRQTSAFATRGNHIRATNENRGFCGLFQDRLGRAQNTFIFAFREHNTAAFFGGGFKHGPHQKRRLKDRFVERVAIRVQIIHRFRGDTRFHRGLCHSGGHHGRQAWIEWFWDQIIDAECQLFALIGSSRFGAGGRARELCDPRDAGQLHFVIDLCRTHIEGTAEDERETQHIVDLVWKIAAPSRNYCIRCHPSRYAWLDFGVWIGQREDDRLLGHF